MVGHADRQPASVAEPDAGRGRCAGGARRRRLDARWSAPQRIESRHAIRHGHRGPAAARPDVAAARRRCTAPHQHHRHPSGRDRKLRRRPAGPRCRRPRARARWTCSAELVVRAHLAERVIDDIAADPHDERLAQLVGSRVGPGFRSTVGKLFPDEVAAGRPAAPAARRLGRRGTGLRLRGAARGDHSGHRGEAACRYRRPHGGHLRGFRGGRLAGSVRQAQRHHPIGARTGRAAAGPARLCTRRTAAPARHAAVADAGPRSGRRNSPPTSATRTSTATGWRRSCTSTRSRGRSTRRRERSPPCGECAGAAVAGVPRRHRKCGAHLRA